MIWQNDEIYNMVVNGMSTKCQRKCQRNVKQTVDIYNVFSTKCQKYKLTKRWQLQRFVNEMSNISCRVDEKIEEKLEEQIKETTKTIKEKSKEKSKEPTK